MITLLDGTKLPTHTEFYKLMVKKELPKIIYTFAKTRTKYEYVNMLFEQKGWDITFKQREFPNRYILCIEYKNSVNEWHKGIHNFLLQISRRCTHNIDNIALVSFDSRFKKYQEILKTNGICLIVLSQDYLY